MDFLMSVYDHWKDQIISAAYVGGDADAQKEATIGAHAYSFEQWAMRGSCPGHKDIHTYTYREIEETKHMHGSVCVNVQVHACIHVCTHTLHAYAGIPPGVQHRGAPVAAGLGAEPLRPGAASCLSLCQRAYPDTRDFLGSSWIAQDDLINLLSY